MHGMIRNAHQRKFVVKVAYLLGNVEILIVNHHRNDIIMAEFLVPSEVARLVNKYADCFQRLSPKKIGGESPRLSRLAPGLATEP